jgi:hypothetical protein
VKDLFAFDYILRAPVAKFPRTAPPAAGIFPHRVPREIASRRQYSGCGQALPLIGDVFEHHGRQFDNEASQPRVLLKQQQHVVGFFSVRLTSSIEDVLLCARRRFHSQFPDLQSGPTQAQENRVERRFCAEIMVTESNFTKLKSPGHWDTLGSRIITRRRPPTEAILTLCFRFRQRARCIQRPFFGAVFTFHHP